MNKGKLVQIIGPVIDARFDNTLPDIFNALEYIMKMGKK
ncbi:ATP synthase subunit beta, sodium ion specific [Streptobacillus moniliformis]|nr:ATP synthase subunit beta, sodium ion specific [Streptobacillus moniliformis]